MLSQTPPPVVSTRAPARVQFKNEQAKRRRGTWRATAVCLIAALIAGLFLSLILLLFAPVGLGVALGLVFRAARAAELTWDLVEKAEAIYQSPARNAVGAALAAIIVLPALIPPPLIWLWLRSLALRTTATPWPTTLGIRAPRGQDHEEHQFSNLVAEMAIAAGLPTPMVGVIDDDTPNMAAFGTDHDQAGIVVTTGLLQTLDRGETQMLVAQLTGSIGNGDLRSAASLLSVYRAIGLFLTLTALLISPAAWRAVIDLVRFSFGRGDPAQYDDALAVFDRQLATQKLGRLLLWLPAMLAVPGVTIDFAFGRAAAWGDIAGAALMLIGALILFYGLARLTLGVWTIFVLRWPMAMVARRRCFLADATAVRLAGNPDAMAIALARLNATAAIPASCGLWSHSFVCGPADGVGASVLDALEPSIEARIERLRAMGAMPTEISPAVPKATAVKAGLGAFAIFFVISNFRAAVTLIAIGLGALFLLSAGAGFFLFAAIVKT